MLKMIQKRLPIEISNEDAASIQQKLQTRFNSLFHRIRLEYLNRLGLDESDYALTGLPADSELLIGELFMPEPGVICYIKGLRGSGYLEAGVISNDKLGDTDELFAGIRECISEVRVNLPAWQVPEEYEPMQIEGADPGSVEIDPKNIAAARAIMDSSARSLLSKIKDAGSIFLNKVYTDDRKNAEECIRKFEELKLINKEYAVLCRRTGQQILRVADRSTIDESSQKSFKCFICGNPIAQEVVEEIATSNALCTEMFNDNKWLLILIQGILGDLGVDSRDIQVYKAPKLPTRLFLSLNGQRYLLVLCTEAMTLDQANLISAHLAAYKLHQAIIISTTNISMLMRHHLAKINENVIFHFICDLHNLDSDIKDILTQQLRECVINQLDDISKATPVSIPNLVLARMMPRPVKPKEEAPAPIEAIESAAELEGQAPENEAEAETEVQSPEEDVPNFVPEPLPEPIAEPIAEDSAPHIVDPIGDAMPLPPAIDTLPRLISDAAFTDDFANAAEAEKAVADALSDTAEESGSQPDVLPLPNTAAEDRKPHKNKNKKGKK